MTKCVALQRLLACLSVLPSLLLLGGTAVAADPGRNVCYGEVDQDTSGAALTADSNHERIVLNVDRQSGLTFPGGYVQTVYDAIGKNTDTENGNAIMAVTQGSVIVTSKGGSTADYDHGAHMGLVAMWVRPDGAAKDYDCYSETESATPSVWHCAVRDQNEGLKLNYATLTLLTRPDKYCGIFQDDVIENQNQ